MIRRLDTAIAAAAAVLAPVALVAPVAAQIVVWPDDDPVERSVLPDRDVLDSVTIAPAILELVSRLGSDDYRDRVEATAALFEAAPGLETLLALLEREALDAEQRHRLLLVVRESLIGAPRGALGITMRWRQADVARPGEVEIIALLPDLPAQEVLEVGDRISAVDGEPLFRQDDLVWRVQSKGPGESVRLTVRSPRRDEAGHARLDAEGEPIFDLREVDLALGSADLLVDPSTGRRTRQGPVERDRLRDAEEAARRWGPRPQPVMIRGGPMEPPSASVDEAMVDRHPAIVAIVSQRRIFEGGTVRANPEMREHWRRQLRWLMDMAEQPTLAPDERVFLSRVAERYAELIPR